MGCPGGCASSQAAQSSLECRLSILLLAINAGMLVLEGLAGWLAESTGLLAGDGVRRCRAGLADGAAAAEDQGG